MAKVSFASTFASVSDHISRRVEHRPVADEEVEVILFESVGTLKTGNVHNDRTVAEPTRL